MATKHISSLLIFISLTFLSPLYSQCNNIVVSIPPLAFIVKNISVDKTIKVTSLINSSLAAEIAEPKPSMALHLKKTSLIFLLGNKNLPIEKYLIRLKQQNKLYILTDQTSTDPHIWLSPKKDITLANNIYIELKNKCSLPHIKLTKSYNSFIVKLRAYHKKFLQLQGKTIFTYHPAYYYLEKDYGIKQIAIEKHGIEPSIGWISQLEKKFKGKINFLLVESITNKTKDLASFFGAHLVVINPLEENIFATWDKILKAFNEYRTSNKS